MKVALLIFALALAACHQTPPAATPVPPTPDACKAGLVADLIGKPFTVDLARDARRRTRVAALRVLRPGEAVTMDYREDRLNFVLDDKELIVGLRCG